MARLNGLTAIVTGGGSGFGKGIVEAFAREGASVVVADIDADSAKSVAAAQRERGAAAQAMEVDVADPASLTAAVAECEAQFGGLDIMIANAGIGQRPGAFQDTSAETLRTHFEINAIGAFNSCQAALPALRKRPAASILITVSGIALAPRPQLYGYGMSKAAAMYLMKALAVELAPERIRVNGLFPAVGDTPMLAEFSGGARSAESDDRFVQGLPLGRFITPEDVGQAAVFLSSPTEAGAFTGCALPVDAGRCI